VGGQERGWCGLGGMGGGSGRGQSARGRVPRGGGAVKRVRGVGAERRPRVSSGVKQGVVICVIRNAGLGEAGEPVDVWAWSWGREAQGRREKEGDAGSGGTLQ